MQNRFFELPASKAVESCSGSSGSFVSKYLAAHYQKLQSVKKDLKRLPESEEFFFLQTDKQFNAFTFIPFVLQTESAKRLLATTYSINKRVIEALCDLHKEGLVDEITLLVSDTMLKRNPVTTDLLTAVNREYANINVLFGWSHAKVCLIETSSSKYIIEGSGNWSENAAYEQYILANCANLFAFREKLFTEIEVRYKAQAGKIVEL